MEPIKRALIHLIPGTAAGLVAFLAFIALPLAVACAIVGTMVLFVRELDQVQARYSYDWRKGWDFWTWEWRRNLQWALPGIMILVVAAMVSAP